METSTIEMPRKLLECFVHPHNSTFKLKAWLEEFILRKTDTSAKQIFARFNHVKRSYETGL